MMLSAMAGCGSAESDGSGGKSSKSAEPSRANSSESAPADRVSEQAIQTALRSAQTYVGRGDLASAQTVLEGLAEKAPSDVRAFEQLGQVLYRRSLQARQRGDVEMAEQLADEAAQRYRQAVDIDPDSAGLRHSAGLIVLAAGDEADALELFQSAAELNPSNPQHELFAAQLLINGGRYAEAEAALQRVLELDQDQAHAHASLAVIAMERGHNDRALVRIGKARELEPTVLDFRAQHARILRHAGQPEQAIELLVPLDEAKRARLMVAREIAAGYAALGRHERAAEAWLVAYRNNPNGPNAWRAAMNAADALIDAGQREQALIWLRQAEAMAPNSEQVQAVRQRLSKSGSTEGTPR